MAVDNNKKKGFSGLSDLASEVSGIDEPIKPEPKAEAKPSTHRESSQSQREAASSGPDRKTTSSPPPSQTTGSGKSGGASGGKWILGIIGVIFLIWLINAGDRDNKRSSYSPSSSSQSYSYPQSTQDPEAQTPSSTRSADLQYTKPSVGTDNVLSVAEIRWCIRQGIRIEAMRNFIETSTGIDEFNRIVNDHNSRCGSYRYRQGSQSIAESDVEPLRSQIIEEAVREASRLDRSYQVSTPVVSPSPSESVAHYSPNVGSEQDTKVVQPFVGSYQTSSPVGSLSQSVNNNAHNSLNSRSVQDVKIVQQLLTDIGYDPGQVDGVFGEKTSNAIVEFQRTKSGYVEDGRITDSLIKDLRIQASMYAKRKEVQKLLSYLGYDPGPIDGAPNGLTTVAIIAFERHNGIFYGDGRITDDLITKLQKAVSKQNIKKQSSKYTSKSSRATGKVIINCGEGFVSTPEGSCKPLGL